MTFYGYDYVHVVDGAKRCAIVDDGLFRSFTPRAESWCAEGHWCHFVNLARNVLAHENTPETDRVPWDDPRPYSDCLPGCEDCTTEWAEEWFTENTCDITIDGDLFHGGALGETWWVFNGGSGVAWLWEHWVEWANAVLASPATALFVRDAQIEVAS